MPTSILSGTDKQLGSYSNFPVFCDRGNPQVPTSIVSGTDKHLGRSTDLPQVSGIDVSLGRNLMRSGERKNQAIVGRVQTHSRQDQSDRWSTI